MDNFMKILISTFAVLCGALLAQAEVRTETIEYKQGDTTLEGYLAYDDAFRANVPACSSCINGSA